MYSQTPLIIKDTEEAMESVCINEVSVLSRFREIVTKQTVRNNEVSVKRVLTVYFRLTNFSKQPAYQYIDFQKRPSSSARINL